MKTSIQPQAISAIRGSMRARVLVLFGVGIVLSATFGSSSAQALRPPFQALLNPDGSGRIFVNDGSKPEWQACKPDLSSCSPFATGGDISTDGAAPETVFWGGEDLLSPVWYGTVSSVTPPSVSGEVRANELVVPVPAAWHGGWEDDYDSMALSACTSTAGNDCVSLLGNAYQGCNGQEGAAVLDPALTGRFLRVVDRRYARDTAFAGVGEAAYHHEGTVDPTPTTAVAIVGRIARATGPRRLKCGPPPLDRASISKEGVATVQCGLGCHAVLVARRGTRRARVARKLPPIRFLRPRGGSSKLHLPSRVRDRLGPGRARMIVKVDGMRIAQRTVNLRASRRPTPTPR